MFLIDVLISFSSSIAHFVDRLLFTLWVHIPGIYQTIESIYYHTSESIYHTSGSTGIRLTPTVHICKISKYYLHDTSSYSSRGHAVLTQRLAYGVRTTVENDCMSATAAESESAQCSACHFSWLILDHLHRTTYCLPILILLCCELSPLRASWVCTCVQKYYMDQPISEQRNINNPTNRQALQYFRYRRMLMILKQREPLLLVYLYTFSATVVFALSPWWRVCVDKFFQYIFFQTKQCSLHKKFSRLYIKHAWEQCSLHDVGFISFAQFSEANNTQLIYIYVVLIILDPSFVAIISRHNYYVTCNHQRTHQKGIKPMSASDR